MTQGLTMWMCTKCWHVLSRSTVEERPPDASTVCPECGGVGSFVSSAAREFGEMVNDLLFESYIAEVRAAGYPVVSMTCSVGVHDRCDGRVGDEQPCDCPCHSTASG